MTTTAGAARKVVTAVRVVSAVALAFLCGLLAVGSSLMAIFTVQPWPGQQRNPSTVVLSALLTLALVIGPMVAWWFLIPQAKWWGNPVTLGFAIGMFILFTQ